MGKRLTAAQRRKARQARVDNARLEWSDAMFGLRVEDVRGRMRLVCTLESEPDMALLQLGRLQALVSSLEGDLVGLARAQGATWEDVGYLLGLTAEGARRRHPGADGVALQLVGEDHSDRD